MRESATLREILDILHRAYAGKVGIEYRHIQARSRRSGARSASANSLLSPSRFPEIRNTSVEIDSADSLSVFFTQNIWARRDSQSKLRDGYRVARSVVEGAARRGVEDITSGGAPGRLNVLAMGRGFDERISRRSKARSTRTFRPMKRREISSGAMARARRETAANSRLQFA